MKAPILKTANFTPKEWALIYKYAPCVAFDDAEVFFPLRVGVSIFYRKTHPPSLISYFQNPPMHRKIFKNIEHFGLILLYGHFPWIYEFVRDRFQPIQTTYYDGFRRKRAAKIIEYAFFYESDIQHIYDLEHIWIYLDKFNQLLALKGTRHGLVTTIYSNLSRFHWHRGHPLLYASPGKHEMMGNLKDMPQKILIHVNSKGAGSFGMYPIQFFTLKHWKALKPVYPGKKAIINYYQRHYAHIPRLRFHKYLIPNKSKLIPWTQLENEIPQIIYQTLKKIKSEIVK